MLATLLLVVLVLIAAVTDATRRHIYNWTTYPGILAGLMLAAIGLVWEWAAPESAMRWQSFIGWLSLSDCVAGLLICGLLMLLCFVFFGTGGGDVKLLAMVGALLGLEKGLEVLLWTFVFGGCVGLIMLIWRIGPGQLLKRGWQLLVSVLTLGIALQPPERERRELHMPVFLGPCAAAAVAAALWLR
jgi:Flp pilus assembly protein protease CpaA